MKFKLIPILLLVTFSVFSQKNKTKFRKYLLIDKYNDTTVVYGKKLSIEDMQKGFKIFDENGKRTKHRVTPDIHIKYIVYTDNNDTIKLISLKPIKHLAFYRYRNAFMQVYIENSDKDLAKGKIDFYVHRYTGSSPTGVAGGPNGTMIYYGGSPVDISIYYIKDINGLHQINHKRHFKRFPKLLGKKKWTEMKKSKKGSIQFLIDYFTEYNNAIEDNIKRKPTNVSIKK